MISLPVYLLILAVLVALFVFACKNDAWEWLDVPVAFTTVVYFFLSFVGLFGKSEWVASEKPYKVTKGEHTVFVEFEGGTTTQFNSAEAFINADNLVVGEEGVRTVWGYVFAPQYSFKVGD